MRLNKLATLIVLFSALFLMDSRVAFGESDAEAKISKITNANISLKCYGIYKDGQKEIKAQFSEFKTKSDYQGKFRYELPENMPERVKINLTCVGMAEGGDIDANSRHQNSSVYTSFFFTEGKQLGNKEQICRTPEWRYPIQQQPPSDCTEDVIWAMGHLYEHRFLNQRKCLEKCTDPRIPINFTKEEMKFSAINTAKLMFYAKNQNQKGWYNSLNSKDNSPKVSDITKDKINTATKVMMYYIPCIILAGIEARVFSQPYSPDKKNSVDDLEKAFLVGLSAKRLGLENAQSAMDMRIKDTSKNNFCYDPKEDAPPRGNY